MRKGAWKKYHWDKWTFWKKVRHVLAVISSIIAVIVMLAVSAYIILVFFGIYGFMLKIRDTVLLEMMKSIFG